MAGSCLKPGWPGSGLNYLSREHDSVALRRQLFPRQRQANPLIAPDDEGVDS
jgi:hypothetical protein